jgi:hypothetical protein
VAELSDDFYESDKLSLPPNTDPLWLDFDATAPLSLPAGTCRVCQQSTSARAVCPYCNAYSPQARRVRSQASELWHDLGLGLVIVVVIGVAVFLLGVLSAGGPW